MPSVTFEKLMQSLKKKEYQPVYFLHGPEPFFIDYISDFIAENALTESERSFNQLVLYGKDTDANTLINACTRYPLMASRQVVIVKEAQSMKGLGDLEKYFNNPAPTTVLVMCHKYKSLDKRLKFTKVLEAKSVVFESKPLAENKLPGWVEEFVKEEGATISPRAAHTLVEYLGSDLEKLANAVRLLTSGLETQRQLDVKDVEEKIGFSREFKPYELNDALGNRDIVKITRMVNFLSAHQKEFPIPVITSLLYGYFSKLAAIWYSKSSDKDTLKAFGVMDWVQRDYIRAAQAYGPRLRYVLKILQEYDLRFKGVDDTGTDSAELLKEMVYRIAYL